MKEYTKEQLKFIEFNGPESIILSATAGSGKTHSTVGRLNYLLANGVDPNRIIFFSFTNDAVNELKNRINSEVKITTIHSFTTSILGKLGRFKPIVTFHDFINWYRDKKKPSFKDPKKIREEYYSTIERFYEESSNISSSFSAYKLQFYDGIKTPKPNFYDHYVAFLKETKSRDFSDMLIDTEKLTKDPQYKDFFNGMYDYIFIDEYQDTSTLQMKILSAINAKQYYLIGDKNQCLVYNQDVLTDKGYRKIQNLKRGDLVLSALGSNKLGYKPITNIKKSFSGICGFVELETKSGKIIKTTANHTHFAQFDFNNNNKYLVYLMYKKGYGYRIGKTEIYPKRNIENNSNRFGFKFRLNQEHADKIWILDSYDSLNESLLAEQEYSLKYGIPTICFVARQRQDQKYIDELFSRIDTTSKALQLLKDLYYLPLQPHFVPKSKKEGLTNITVNLCTDGRYNKPLHTLEVNGYNEKVKNFFNENGYITTDNGKGSGWRIRKQSKDYREVMKSISLISDDINLILRAKFIDKTFLQLPASQIVPGMSLMTINDKNEIITDEVINRTIVHCDHTVYDIDVEDSHNLVVNGIITHNSIYSFSGANCEKIESLLKQKKTVVELTLTKNFRSHKKIVENANKFSSLVAIPESKNEGFVDTKFINKKELFEMMRDGKPLTILVRTNNVIKEIEKQALKKKIPMRYFNYITKTDLDNIKKSNITDSIKKKLNEVLPYFLNNQEFTHFIESNSDSEVFVTSIHKSKGREFPRCVVINSADPEMLINHGSITHSLSEYSFVTDDGEIDEESKNIHYVAVTRPKEELYFMIYDDF